MLIAYTLEILPFNVRAKGFAIMVTRLSSLPTIAPEPYIQIRQNCVVSLTLAFNQFVNPWALDAIGWRYVRLLLPSVSNGLIIDTVPRLLWMAHHRARFRRGVHRRDPWADSRRNSRAL